MFLSIKTVDQDQLLINLKHFTFIEKGENNTILFISCMTANEFSVEAIYGNEDRRDGIFQYLISLMCK